jgi:hypothetical protein
MGLHQAAKIRENLSSTYESRISGDECQGMSSAQALRNLVQYDQGLGRPIAVEPIAVDPIAELQREGAIGQLPVARAHAHAQAGSAIVG